MSRSVEATKLIADAAYRQQQYADAAAGYSQAIALSEEQQQPALLHLLYGNRAAARLALGDFQGALADAQAATAVDDSWTKGWYRSAKALQGLGRLDMAVMAARKAQALEPNNKEVRQLLKQLDQQHPPKQQQQQQYNTPGQPGVETSQLPTPISQMPQRQRPWREINQMRAQLDLSCLPQELVVGTRYIPSPDGVNQNLLLLLHGLGDTPAAFTRLATRMALPQTACLALSGPLLVPETQGGRSWFCAFEPDGELIQPSPQDKRRRESLDKALQLLQRTCFEALPAAGMWRPAEIQLLGFSQGGCVALSMAQVCGEDRPLGGAVSISGALLEEALEHLAQKSSNGRSPSHSSCTAGSSSSSKTSSGAGTRAAGTGTPVLVTWGDQDDMLDKRHVDRSVKELQATGCDVQLIVVPGKGHGMISSEAEMRRCMQFWAANLKRRPVDAGFDEVATVKQ